MTIIASQSSDGIIGWAWMGYSDTQPGSVYQLLSLDTQLRYLTWILGWIPGRLGNTTLGYSHGLLDCLAWLIGLGILNWAIQQLGAGCLDSRPG